jgi:cobalt-zinc-cadmium efflux system membrane fusion protein
MRGTLSRGVWDQLDGLLFFGATGHLSDEELLGRFVARRDDAAEAAFAALVDRHGPMVLGVCRRALGDRHDAEDAFQATFLVLARKATSIARPEQLANWLFGVAHRIALDARARTRHRRARERRAYAISRAQNAPAGDDQLVSDDLRAILDEELARLPECYRGALVLCELNGLTRRAAARQLGIPEGTLSSRLARAKNLLRRRLLRREFALSALALDRALAREVLAMASGAPRSLVDSTVQAATRVATGATLADAASTSIASLAHGALKAMLLTKVTEIALGLATLAVITTGVGGRARGPEQVAGSAIHQGQNASVAIAQPPSTITTRALVLPGSTQLDPARLDRIRARFAPARVVQVAQVPDRSPNSGTAVRRDLRPGDRVSKGDLLAVFYSADVASTKNDLLDALVQLELDQKILDLAKVAKEAVPQVFMLAYERAVQQDQNASTRTVDKLKLWHIPQGEIDALHAEARKIHADRANGARVAPHVGADDSLGEVTVRADRDGVVIECNIHTGEMVVDDTVNLFQIADVSRLEIIVNCPEASLPALAALRGDDRRWAVRTVVPASNTPLTGTIDEIGFVIDPNQHTAVVKGYVENDGQRIRAGQFVTVTVNIPPPEDSVEIPTDALVDDGKQSVVFVQPDPARPQFTMRRVEVTQRQGGKVLVRSTPIPKEEQPAAAEAKQGLLPKEPLRQGERVLLHRAPESVENRLGAVERKLDQVLQALGALTRPAATKSDVPRSDAPK